MQDNTLIKVQGLSVEFPLSSKKKVHAVSNVSLDVKEHEVLALVGESGPDHDKSFTVEVSLNGAVIGKGTGTSKKRAEQDAARAAMETLFPQKT